MEAIQVVFEELRKKGKCCSVISPSHCEFMLTVINI